MGRSHLQHRPCLPGTRTSHIRDTFRCWPGVREDTDGTLTSKNRRTTISSKDSPHGHKSPLEVPCERCRTHYQHIVLPCLSNPSLPKDTRERDRADKTVQSVKAHEHLSNRDHGLHRLQPPAQEERTNESLEWEIVIYRSLWFLVRRV